MLFTISEQFLLYQCFCELLKPVALGQCNWDYMLSAEELPFSDNNYIGISRCHGVCYTEITFPKLLPALPKYAHLSLSLPSVLVDMGLIMCTWYMLDRPCFQQSVFLFSPFTWTHSHTINIMVPFVQYDVKEFQGLELFLNKSETIF